MSKPKISFYFLIRSHNAFPYLGKCLDSLQRQSRQNYKVLFVDDASEYTRAQQNYIKQRLKGHIVQFNQEQKFSLRNAYEMIHEHVDNDEAIIINLDGDDWLIRDDVIDVVDKTYEVHHCLLTYGNCVYHAPGEAFHNKKGSEVIPTINQRYPDKVENLSSYRKEGFRPLHLRTWKAREFKNIPKKYFLRSDGNWVQFCEDQAIFLPLLEKADGRYEVISTPLSAYNRHNPNSDSKLHLYEMLSDEVTILKMKPLK